MSTLELAIEIAAKAHAGQLDKAGQVYILHPIRVMMMGRTDEERIVGVLHDVIEDCPDWSREQLLQAGFTEQVLDALDAVTKREGESYEDFVLRAGQNSIARNVKLADLRDNSDLSRLPSPTPKDYQRTEKYQRAIAVLEAMELSSAR